MSNLAGVPLTYLSKMRGEHSQRKTKRFFQEMSIDILGLKRQRKDSKKNEENNHESSMFNNFIGKKSFHFFC